MKNDRLCVANDVHLTVEKFVTSLVKEFLQMDEDNNGVDDHPQRITWGGTKCDLLELLKVAYDSGQIMTPEGVQMTFSELVRRVFKLLNIQPMNNPYARLQRAELRKGIRSASVRQKLEYIAECNGEGKMREYTKQLIISC